MKSWNQWTQISFILRGCKCLSFFDSRGIFSTLLLLTWDENQLFPGKIELLWIKIFIIGNRFISSPQIQIYNIIPLSRCGRADISCDCWLFVHRRILKHTHCLSHHSAWRYHRRHYLLYFWQMGNTTILQKIHWKIWIETWKHRQSEGIFWCQPQ